MSIDELDEIFGIDSKKIYLEENKIKIYKKTPYYYFSKFL